MINCDLHIHSNFSDGWNEIEDVLRDGDAMGLEVMAVTDHYHKIGNGKVDDYINKITAVRDNYLPKVLIGTEVLMDNQEGQIGLNEAERNKFDIVLVELMSGLLFDPEDTRWETEKANKNKLIDTVFASYINICNNSLVDVIAHPFNLGRIKNTEYHFKLRDLPTSLLKEMAGAMVKHKKAFGISSQFYYWHPNQRVAEVTEEYSRIISLFAEEGVRFSVGTDAHSVGTIGNLHWALSVIERAGLSKNWNDWFVNFAAG